MASWDDNNENSPRDWSWVIRVVIACVIVGLIVNVVQLNNRASRLEREMEMSMNIEGGLLQRIEGHDGAIEVVQGDLQRHEEMLQVRTCVAPCTVVFPREVLEDEFEINYTWRDKNTPVLQVWDGGAN